MAAIPTRVNDMIAYDPSGVRLGAVTEATLPEIEFLSESLDGAGFGGSIDLPSNRVGPMSLTCNWRTVTKAAVALSAPTAQSWELRGSIETESDSGEGSGTEKLRAIVVTKPSKYTPGKLAPNATMDAAAEFSVLYYKLELAGEVLAEIDVLNRVCIVLGVDYAAATRDDLEG